MSTLRALKQRLANVSRLWDEEDYDEALAEVERLLEMWPGNPHLHVLKASLVQLQEKPTCDLDEAKQSLQRAIELDRDSPMASIELGHFLDNVEDDPQAAVKAYAEGVSAARHLLIDGLIGQAKAYRQLEKKEDFVRCLLEVLRLVHLNSSPKRNKANELGAEEVQELLTELVNDHQAESGSASNRDRR